MTKQIPGFTNDDRSLFTEIIIGIPKIRHYLNTYGKGKNSESNLAKLSRNLDEIEEYIDHKNELITDDARLLRLPWLSILGVLNSTFCLTWTPFDLTLKSLKKHES
jgi:hypothetical protein